MVMNKPNNLLADLRNLKIPGKTLPRCERKNHYKKWTEACKKGLKQHVR